MDWNINRNSSLDTLILNCENSEKRKTEPLHKRKHLHKREHTEKKSNEKKNGPIHINCSDQHISQKIHVEKQDFRCIINLNTTVCDHKSKHRKKCDKRRRSNLLVSQQCEEKRKSMSSIQKGNAIGKDKIVPKCARQVCIDHYYKEDSVKSQEGCRRSKIEHCNREKRKVTRGKVECRHRERIKRMVTKDKNQRKPKYERHKNRHHSNIEIKHKCSRVLSPISSSPLNDFDNTFMYEDISSTSLETTYVEKPKCYKYVNKCSHMKNRRHNEEDFFLEETKLDTLIKRTKERERKLVQLSRVGLPRCTSSPISKNLIDSGNVPMSNSDMDISFNSQSTLVLKPCSSIVSSPPCPIKHLENFEPEKLIKSYSPSSPTRNQNYMCKVSNDNNYKLVNIKNESIMDIEAYSPICSPDNLMSNMQKNSVVKCVKKEVECKTEPLLSPKISPIHCGKGSGLQLCKSEIVHET